MSDAESPRSFHTGPPADRTRYRAVLAPDVVPGAVVRAVGPAGRVVACKQLGAVGADAERAVRERFESLGPVASDGIAGAVDVFRGPGWFGGVVPSDDECDTLYWVSEWIEGDTLWSRRESLSATDAGPVIAAVGRSLGAMHRAGVVHGDVHPSNVILDAAGRPTLIDLDAPVRSDGHPSARPAGIVGFMPPEAHASSGSDGWQVAMLAIQVLLGHPVGRSDHDLAEELQVVLGPSARAVHDHLRMMLDEPAAERPDVEAWSAQFARLLDEPDQSGRTAVSSTAKRMLIGFLVVAILVAGAIGWSQRSSPEPATNVAPETVDEGLPRADPQSGRCDYTIEGHEPPPEQAMTLVPGGVADRLTGGRCRGPAELFSTMVIVPVLVDGGDDHGVVVIGPGGEAVALTDVQWASYRDIAGRQRPENAADVGGAPIDVRGPDPAGVSTIELATGGILVQPTTVDQAFWIPAQLRPMWEAAGGVDGAYGFPTSNPYFHEGTLHQDFERVEVVTTPDAMFRPIDQIDFEVRTPPNVGAPLRELAPIEGRILRQRSGVAWFVVDGERHWIPDGDTYFCVGGDEAVIPVDLPGWAVWSLPLGEPARCP